VDPAEPCRCFPALAKSCTVQRCNDKLKGASTRQLWHVVQLCYDAKSSQLVVISYA
jgi:hypothetical protein